MSTDSDPRRVYERVLRIVQYNTGGPQPASVWRLSTVSIATNAGMDSNQVDKAVRAARDNGDLLAHDRDGHTRLARTDTASVRSLLLEEADREPSDKALVGKCNRLLDEAGV